MKRIRQKGFTLIELLVVIAIIGILATVVISSLNKARAKARDARRVQDIKSIQTALEMYYLDHGTYPTTSWRFSNNSTWDNLKSYLGNLPVDPINEAGGPYSGKFSYAYFAHQNSGFCSGQAYMILYNKETENGTGPEDGIRFCNNTLYNYGNAFVVGMDKDGVLHSAR